MKWFWFMLVSFFLVGCTKTQTCDLGKSVTSLVSAQVASSLACKNLEAVKTDIEKKLVDLKICEEKPQAQTAAKMAIGDVICKPVIDGLTAGLVAQIPAAWECSGGALTEEMKAKLLEACNKAL